MQLNYYFTETNETQRTKNRTTWECTIGVCYAIVIFNNAHTIVYFQLTLSVIECSIIDEWSKTTKGKIIDRLFILLKYDTKIYLKKKKRKNGDCLFFGMVIAIGAYSFWSKQRSDQTTMHNVFTSSAGKMHRSCKINKQPFWI